MRKIAVVLAVVFGLGLLGVAAPAGAMSPEGCIVTPAAHACSGMPGSGAGATGIYTVTAGHTVGVTGAGPYDISWTDPDGLLGPCVSGSHPQPAGGTDADVPLVAAGCAGTVVTATSTGGSLAVGDTQ